MPDVNQQFNQLRGILYNIIKSIGDQASKPASRVKAEINQYLTVDDDTFKDLEGNVIIIQNATMNTQIINQGTEALQLMDDLQQNYIETDGLASAIKELYLRGTPALDIIEIVRGVCINIAERATGDTAKAAKSLGIKRTTLIAWRRRRDRWKLKQLTITEGE